MTDSNAFTIRRALPQDAVALAGLCTQLGYPSTLEQVQSRLAALLNRTDQAVFTAALPDGRLAGWAHAACIVEMESDLMVELIGLVVADGLRGMGIGKALLSAVEDWARSAGANTVRLRSNVLRTRAHAFYEREGYIKIKTQAAFQKQVA